MKTSQEQRARSYTEHSTLLSTPSPSRWRRYYSTHRRHSTIRQDVWTVLRFRSSVQHRYGLQLASYVLELSVLTLILLNVVVAISEIKWMTRPLSLIDLMALVPFYLELSMSFDTHHHGGLTLRSLRLLRIVSFLRLERMYNAMKNLRVIFARKKEELLVVTYLTGVVLLTSSLLIFFLEHLAQPSVFSSFGVCVWWSVETITSLGYGDVVPITGLGRMVGATLALWGIILFTIPGAVLGSGFIEVMLEKQREEEAEMYSMAMGCGSSTNANNSHFVGSFSDDEQLHGYNHAEHEHSGYTSTPAPAHTPISVTSPKSPHFAAMRMEALHQKVEAITSGQRHLETQFRQQQQQLESLQPMATRACQTGFLNMIRSTTTKTEKAAQPQERVDIVLGESQ
ncbi:Voltage-gated Ion Channel [Phytophthora megakarya]|uniref:Voltage-gated Ion Channel n=1 Tax=Phytophthora megakarya TaxID=4795 RepID=A0A225VBX6_9STRA|nr:Voltage-gated Ion Channel [Phytophthora megakarya]